MSLPFNATEGDHDSLVDCRQLRADRELSSLHSAKHSLTNSVFEPPPPKIALTFHSTTERERSRIGKQPLPQFFLHLVFYFVAHSASENGLLGATANM